MRSLVLLVSLVAISACVALEKIAGEKKGVFHQAERPQNGMLVLTANNGFFDNYELVAETVFSYAQQIRDAGPQTNVALFSQKLSAR